MGSLTWSLVAIIGLANCAWAAPRGYGAKGIYPVYDVAGTWLIFDKKKPGRRDRRLKVGSRFLTIGSRGKAVFTVRRTSMTYGGACRGQEPLPLRAAVLRGPRRKVGTPVLAIRVSRRFSLKGSKARQKVLGNQVGEDTYRKLLEPLRKRIREEILSGKFRTTAMDHGPDGRGMQAGRPADLPAEERARSAVTKIEFGSTVSVSGRKDPFVLVEDTQVPSGHNRCLRMADGAELVGSCAKMPHDLMAETGRLRFFSYDPSGRGRPLVLAYTVSEPLWGHERWGFLLKKSGPKVFLSDSMDIRCREGF